MGYCVTLPEPENGGPKMFGLEIRRESLTFSCHYTQWPPETEPSFFPSTGDGSGHGLEVTKAYIAELLAYFDNPENRAMCGLEVPPPFAKGE